MDRRNDATGVSQAGGRLTLYRQSRAVQRRHRPPRDHIGSSRFHSPFQNGAMREQLSIYVIRLEVIGFSSLIYRILLVSHACDASQVVLRRDAIRPGWASKVRIDAGFTRESCAPDVAPVPRRRRERFRGARAAGPSLVVGDEDHGRNRTTMVPVMEDPLRRLRVRTRVDRELPRPGEGVHSVPAPWRKGWAG